MLTIGKLARLAEITTDAIRFYEREALVAPTTKTEAGYRLYDDFALRRLRFIKHAQQCGFSLTEIRGLLALKANGDGCCHDVRMAAIEKKLFLEHKIKALTRMINIEVFSAPGCSKCAEAKALLEKIVAESGRDCSWRDVNILDELEYAVELGVLSAPAIAIDGKLVFTSLPSATALLAELEKRV